MPIYFDITEEAINKKLKPLDRCCPVLKLKFNPLVQYFYLLMINMLVGAVVSEICGRRNTPVFTCGNIYLQVAKPKMTANSRLHFSHALLIPRLSLLCCFFRKSVNVSIKWLCLLQVDSINATLQPESNLSGKVPPLPTKYHLICLLNSFSPYIFFFSLPIFFRPVSKKQSQG